MSNCLVTAFIGYKLILHFEDTFDGLFSDSEIDDFVKARVDHPGMTQSIFSKTGMVYRGTRDDLVRAQGCTSGAYY